MTDTNEPTLFSQLWAQVEPTILGDNAKKSMIIVNGNCHGRYR